MGTGTYIKLYRSLIDHDTLQNDNTAFIVFTKLLLKVNYKTGTIRIGRHKLSALTNIPKSTCWDALRRLETDSIVTVSSTGSYTDIHICNWEKYQGGSDSSADNRPYKNRSQTDTINKNKRIRSKNNNTELLKVLNKATGRSFRVLPPNAYETLDKFSIDEIELALNKLVRDDWYKPKVHRLTSNHLLNIDVIDNFHSSETVAERSIKHVSGAAPSKEKLAMPRSKLNALEPIS